MTTPLHVRFEQGDALRLQGGLLAIPVFEDGKNESRAFKAVDGALGGFLRKFMAEESFTGKVDSSMMAHTHGKIGPSRVVLLGCGKAAAFDFGAVQHLAARTTRAAGKIGVSAAALAVDGLPRATRDRARTATLAALGAELGRYKFDKYLTGPNGKKPETKATEASFTLVGIKKAADVTKAAARGQRIARAIAEIRDLVNEPASVCNPALLAEKAKAYAKASGLECKVLGAEECRKLGMNLYLAVGQGSDNEPRFLHVAYKPKRPKKRIAIIGKGITFDSGGLSLKPANFMETMKTDMAGAATVLASVAAVADLGGPNEVHAIVAACENMPSGKSYRPGDVFMGMGGKSVEVNNTDAEGRLTLADAIAYAKKIEPDEMIDLATLTGACVVGLGPHTAGIMGTDAKLIGRLLETAEDMGESMWQLPLIDRLWDQMKSDVADMKNTGERYGGAITAGLFLRQFAGEQSWAHIDIAGPSHTDKEWGALAKGGTGFGAATLIDYLTH